MMGPFLNGCVALFASGRVLTGGRATVLMLDAPVLPGRNTGWRKTSFRNL